MVNMCSRLPVQIFPKHTGSDRTFLIIYRGSCPKFFWHCHSDASAVTSFLAESCMSAKIGGSYFPVFPKNPFCHLVCAGTVVHVAMHRPGNWSGSRHFWQRKSFLPLLIHAMRKIIHRYSGLCTAVTCVQRYQTPISVSKWGVSFCSWKTEME